MKFLLPIALILAIFSLSSCSLIKNFFTSRRLQQFQNCTSNCIQVVPNLCDDIVNQRFLQCQNLQRDIPFYYRRFYQCIYQDPSISHECAELFCKQIILDQYCVNCSDFSYNYSLPMVELKTAKKIENKIETCDSNTIVGCTIANELASDYCQQNVDPSKTQNYYDEYYKCIKNYPSVAELQGCSKCICTQLRLSFFNVNCSDDQPSNNNTFNPLDLCQVNYVPCCQDALQLAESNCRSSIQRTTPNYYQSFYNCIKNDAAVMNAKNCAYCYCKGILLQTDKVCNDSLANIFMEKE